MARSSKPQSSQARSTQGGKGRPAAQPQARPGKPTKSQAQRKAGPGQKGYQSAERSGQTQRPQRAERSGRGERPDRVKAQGQASPGGASSREGNHPLANLPANTYLVPGRQPVLEALKAKRPVQAIICERNLALGPITNLAQAAKVPIAFAGRDELTEATQGVLHQGVVAVLPEPEEGVLADHLHHDLVVVADGITDARNLGAIARSAEQAGAGCLIVRARRAASNSPAAEKAGAGAFSWLPVITVSNITNAVNNLKDAGMWAVALDGGDEAANLFDLNLMDERVVLVVGEEGAGVSRVVKAACDAVATIPMRGHLDSLNASVAAGVALFEWVRRHP